MGLPTTMQLLHPSGEDILGKAEAAACGAAVAKHTLAWADTCRRMAIAGWQGGGHHARARARERAKRERAPVTVRHGPHPAGPEA